MKKSFMICLSAFCMVFILAGCGNKNDTASYITNSPLPSETIAPTVTHNDADELYDDEDNNDADNLGDRVEDAGETVKEGAQEAGDVVREGAEAAGDKVKEGINDVKNNTKNTR